MGEPTFESKFLSVQSASQIVHSWEVMLGALIGISYTDAVAAFVVIRNYGFIEWLRMKNRRCAFLIAFGKRQMSSGSYACDFLNKPRLCWQKTKMESGPEIKTDKWLVADLSDNAWGLFIYGRPFCIAERIQMFDRKLVFQNGLAMHFLVHGLFSLSKSPIGEFSSVKNMVLEDIWTEFEYTIVVLFIRAPATI